MAKKNGTDILIAKWVSSGTPAYKVLVCLRDTSINRTKDTIDASSKCTDGYSESLGGRKTIELAISGVTQFAPASGELGIADLRTDWDSDLAYDYKIYSRSADANFVTQYFNARTASLNETYNDADVAQFDATFAVNGGFTTVDPHA